MSCCYLLLFSRITPCIVVFTDSGERKDLQSRWYLPYDGAALFEDMPWPDLTSLQLVRA